MNDSVIVIQGTLAELVGEEEKKEMKWPSDFDGAHHVQE